MANITINDIKSSNKMSASELEQSKGGFFYNYNWLYRPVVSYFQNPFVASLQSTWISRGQTYSAMNQQWLNNFMSS